MNNVAYSGKIFRRF